MAKIRHNHFLDTVDGVISDAKRQGLLHLYAQGDSFDGRHIEIENRSLKHFGTTGYLGLGLDPRLKQAAIRAIRSYGTQFPLSKTYISHPLYSELEDKVSQMYGLPILITKNSSLGHIAVIPTVIGDRDGVILDHQVHWSVQYAVQSLKSRGIPVHMIRHNNLEMLEHMIRELSGKCRKIWYMADGVYSMFGDCAPIPELRGLLAKYSQLYLYIDDVHGMSWAGINGTGYVLKEFGILPEQVLLFGTLSKSFGASGAVFITADVELHRKVRNFGGPLTFSAQLEPASVAAAIASAKIHLSPEIRGLQNELSDKIEFLNLQLSGTELPLVDTNTCPVFYIGTGSPATGYNFVKRLMSEGFFVNLGLYPAVPVKNTGVRLTISRHNTKSDIADLVNAMAYNYPKALEETNTTTERVHRAFGMSVQRKYEAPKVPEGDVDFRYETSIEAIDRDLWNSLFSGANTYDWEGLHFLEQATREFESGEHFTKFHYFIAVDVNHKVIMATFLTTSLWKDDMLAPPSVSEKIEGIRKNDPYYLTSKVLAMGSLFSTGSHGYFNTVHPKFKAVFRQFVQVMENLMEEEEAALLVLRDFPGTENWNDLLLKQGFFSVSMPESNIVPTLDWTTRESYLRNLSARSRRHFRKDVAPYEPYFRIHFKDKLEASLILHCYRLYLNVHQKNLSLNTYPYPIKLFESMSKSPHWEFMIVSLKPKYQIGDEKMPIGVMFCYKNQNITYVPHLIGLDYRYVEKYQLYRQMLYQSLKRAQNLGFKKVDFGVSASFEKKKIGAFPGKQWAYVQAKDNYSMEYLETL